MTYEREACQAAKDLTDKHSDHKTGLNYIDHGYRGVRATSNADYQAAYRARAEQFTPVLDSNLREQGLIGRDSDLHAWGTVVIVDKNSQDSGKPTPVTRGTEVHPQPPVNREPAKETHGVEFPNSPSIPWIRGLPRPIEERPIPSKEVRPIPFDKSTTTNEMTSNPRSGEPHNWSTETAREWNSKSDASPAAGDAVFQKRPSESQNNMPRLESNSGQLNIPPLWHFWSNNTPSNNGERQMQPPAGASCTTSSREVVSSAQPKTTYTEYVVLADGNEMDPAAHKIYLFNPQTQRYHLAKLNPQGSDSQDKFIILDKVGKDKV